MSLHVMYYRPLDRSMGLFINEFLKVSLSVVVAELFFRLLWPLLTCPMFLDI